jgi:hypothetical protein
MAALPPLRSRPELFLLCLHGPSLRPPTAATCSGQSTRRRGEEVELGGKHEGGAGGGAEWPNADADGEREGEAVVIGAVREAEVELEAKVVERPK